jgi:[NiFe] hydrogenase large subunit
VENALRISVPENARIVRNLLMGAQFLHDHIVHFYHLHALDWVDIVSALSADPAKTSALAKVVSPSARTIDFAATLARLKTFAESGKLGPFAAGYWGHPAYALSPQENLLLAAHYLEALRQQASTARMHAIFGAKNPHPQSLRVGGVTCYDKINPTWIESFRAVLQETRAFVDQFYIPDVLFLASRYPEWGNIGGNDNFLAFGEFPQNQSEPASLFLPRGVILNRGEVAPVDTSAVLEHVTHSWYQGTTALHPYEGETVPQYTELNTQDRYSWLKAPRYQGQAMEVGPLARVLVAYKSGRKEVRDAVDAFLVQAKLPVTALYSTLGRTAARALETQVIGNAMLGWLGELTLGGKVLQSSTMVLAGQGVGYNEAPRGALGHWIRIENGKIGNYQMVVPSTWNFGPRCAKNIPGPAEHALADTPVADASQPLEILRTVHSLDPCIACAVHVIDLEADRVYQVRAA